MYSWTREDLESCIADIRDRMDDKQTIGDCIDVNDRAPIVLAALEAMLLQL